MDELFLLINRLTGGDDIQAEAAAREVASHGSRAFGGLTPLLSDPDPERRWWGVRTLAEIKHEQSVNLLIQALGDPDPAVRGCAARGLQEQPDERAIPVLVAALADGDSLVARLASNALAAAGRMAVPALLELLQGAPSLPRLEAARALALIGDTRSIPALFEALDSDSMMLEYWANEGLERMGVGMTFFFP